MNSKPTPQSILHDIAQIQQLDRGTVSIIRQGPQGPYHNHQCYENGRNVSRYVPPEQVADLKAALDGYHQVQEMMAQYVQLMVDKTRAERAAGFKKKRRPPKSSSPKIRKSSG
jgi:ketol-acid reductoisomerase